MKQLNLIITSTVTVVLLLGCGNSTGVAPSQNSALNSISPTKAKSNGYIQEGLDSWLEEDWTPTVEKNEEVRTKYMEKVEIEAPKEVTATQITTKKELEENSSQKLSQKNSLEIQKEVKYVEKKDKYPTLQEYLDKADAYFEAQERDLENSHIEKMKKMPVIGE
jgi:16S rRNA C967 or C1407 C5-methylase (RsmB/RsmF family)